MFLGNRSHFIRFVAAVAVAAIVPAEAARSSGKIAVDLELVLAVDISGSMNAQESALQRQGYAAALSDTSFLRAIEAGPLGRIAVAYVEWAGADRQSLSVPWQIIDNLESARAFAAKIDIAPRNSARGTSISGVMDFAGGLVAGNEYDGQRKVIDISGDGPNNAGRPVLLARSETAYLGITINGLPILVPGENVIENLDDYYAECVIAGPGAFSLPVRGSKEFLISIKRKLILEVSGISRSNR
ncbi:MAG: DUF1194 domain-containing protein [Aestuariivirga sp.]